MMFKEKIKSSVSFVAKEIPLNEVEVSFMNNCKIEKEYLKYLELEVKHENIIGSGSYSKVYKTSDSHVIKHIKRENNMLFNILSEIDILFSISHPNILHGDGIFVCRNKIGLILPRCNLTLKHILSYSIPPASFQNIFTQIISGVHHLHQRRYLHLDLTLKNILINFKMIKDKFDWGSIQIKIADFSLSCLMIKGEVHSEYERITADYRPIEHLYKNSVYTEKSDVWSLGIIFYSLIKRIQFIDTIETMIYDANKNIDWNKTFINHIDKKMKNNSWPNSSISIIDKMLSYNRNDRPYLYDIMKNSLYTKSNNQYISYIDESVDIPSNIEEYENNMSKEIKIEPPVQKICNSIYNRLDDFFDFFDYTKIENDKYLWYKCCYTIAFRLFFEGEDLPKDIKPFINLEYYIIIFLRGKLRD